jgi:hypothetical protein
MENPAPPLQQKVPLERKRKLGPENMAKMCKSQNRLRVQTIMTTIYIKPGNEMTVSWDTVRSKSEVIVVIGKVSVLLNCS